MYTIADLKKGLRFRYSDKQQPQNIKTIVHSDLERNEIFVQTEGKEDFKPVRYYILPLLNKLNNGDYEVLPNIHPVMQEAVDGILASVKLSGDTDYQDFNGPELPGDNEPDFSNLKLPTAPDKIREMRKAVDLWTKLNHRIEEHNVALLEIRSICDELRKLSVFDFLHLDYETVETNPDNPQIGMLLLPGTRPIFKN